MKITIKEAAYLADLIEDKSAVSLLSNISVEKDGSEVDSLTEKDILVDGALSAGAEELLQVLAQAKMSARLVLQDSFVFLEKYVFKHEDKYLIAENDQGDLGIYPLADFDAVTFELAEFLGHSQLKTTDVDIELPVAEMLVLMSLVDLYRVNTLLYHGGVGELKTKFELGEIEEGLKNPEKNGLVKVLSNHYGYQVPPADKIADTLKELQKKELIDKDNGLEEELEFLARSLLIPSALLLVELISEEEDGEIFVDSGMAVAAGVKDIGYFIFGSDIIGLKSLSAAELLEVVKTYIQCPEMPRYIG